jgi:hypothetical protein
MSALALWSDRAALCLAARQSAAGRSRRADDGVLTEMARSLLRDAREAGGGEVRRGHDATGLDRIESVQVGEPGHAGGLSRRRAGNRARGALRTRPGAAQRA